MSFYLVTTNGRSFTWHIPSKGPDLKKLFATNDRTVDILQADGDELGLIMVRLNNIPITHGGICIWRGEMAQFIFDNL